MRAISSFLLPLIFSLLPATAHADKSCYALCGKISECKLWTYDFCMNYCAPRNTKPAETLAQSKWSCKKLAAEMRPSGWSCLAAGTWLPPNDSGGADYSDERRVSMTKNGKTRDAAGIAALDACSGLLHLQANPVLDPGSLVIRECRIMQCSPPSAPSSP